MTRLTFYRRLSIVSGLVLVLLNHFAFGFLAFLVPFAKADAITWVGSSGGYWHNPANWSGGMVPTASDEVIISGDDMFILATSTINFASLTLAGPDVRFGLSGSIGVGGDLTISESLFIQSTSTRQTISGTLTIDNGVMQHLQNTSTTEYKLDFVAENIVIEPGGHVRLDNEGSPGGDIGEDGYGYGGGDADTNGSTGAGASNAGTGGQSSSGNFGGFASCNFGTVMSEPGPTRGGSGGGGSSLAAGGDGGGFVRLEATDTITVNGRITADADYNSEGGAGEGAGGGSGGTIYLVADTISGVPEAPISARGGNSFDSDGGAGGGGCVRVIYTTTSTIDGADIIVDGGVGFENGGAGAVLVEKEDQSIRKMYLTATTTPSYGVGQNFTTASTNYINLSGTDELTTLSVSTSSVYIVGDFVGASELTLTGDIPFQGSSPSGTVRIQGDVELKLSSGASIEDVTLELYHEGVSRRARLVDRITEETTTLDITIGDQGILLLNNFNSTTPLIVGTFTVGAGGVVTHEQNSISPEQTEMVNIQADDITIELGGVVDAYGKGFSGGDSNAANGYGPGAGQYVGDFYQSGGGHGSDGGLVGGGGGEAYCNLSNPSTLGSGGAAAEMVSSTTREGYGGNGGGLVWLSAENVLTIEGQITVGGAGGGYFATTTYTNGGGGSGGAIKLTAGTVTGTPEEIVLYGGWQGLAPGEGEIDHVAVGGGGCMLVEYRDHSSITSSTVSLGNNDPGYSEKGIFNSVPLLRNIGLKNSQPVLVGSVVSSTELNGPFAIVVRGDYAFSLKTAGLSIVDISDKTNPSIVGSVTSSGNSRLALSGNYAYLTETGIDSIRVVDISNPVAPVTAAVLTSSTVLNGVTGIAISGDYVYVATINSPDPAYDGVKVIDISDPLNPVIIGGITDPVNLHGALEIKIVDDYAYVVAGNDNSLRIIDISDPYNIEIVGGVKDDALLGGVGRLEIMGDYAYVASAQNDLFKVINISDPTNPAIVGGLTDGVIDAPALLSISGRHVYVPGQNSDTIFVVDVSDPANPQIVHSVSSTVLDGVRGTYVSDGYLYVQSNNADSLSIFNIENPSLSFQAEDLDKTTLSVKAEYVAGTCVYSDTSYATFSTSTVTSTYGLAAVDNSAGDNRRIQNISTVNNSNNVTSTWLTTTDIPGVEGEYCMFATAYDGVSESGIVTSTIIIDLADVSPSIPSLSSSQSQTSITLSWPAVSGADHYVVVSSISGIPTETDETSVTYAGLVAGNTYTFQIKAVDGYGNESVYSGVFSAATAAIGSSPPPSTPPPPPDTTPSSTATSTVSNPSGLIIINSGAYYTNSRQVTVSFNTEFTSAYILADTQDFTGRIYTPINSSTTYTLTPGDGEKRIYARFSNNYGIYDAYDVIVLDTVPPNQPTINTISSPDLVQKTDGVYERKNTSSTVRIKPTLGGTAEPGKQIVITASYGGTNMVMMVLAAVETYYTTADSNGNWSFTFPNELQNTYYTISVQVQDEAGNASSAVETQLDLRIVENSPCTINCEPPEELPPEDPPEEIPPIEQPPEELPPIETPTDEVASCTIDCGGEESPPVDTGGDGAGTGDETATDTTNGGNTEGNAGSSSDESVSEQVISSITDSVSIISDTIETFFTEVSNSLQEIPIVRGIVETASVAAEKTREVIDNPTVEKSNEVITAPIIAVAAAANVAVGGAGLLSQAMLYLRLIFSQPLLLLKLRKRKSWGVVFNAYTKLPLDLATVRLVNGKNDSIMRTQVTDSKGRYFMVAENGEYRLEAQKDGFGNRITLTTEDSVYPNLYRGEKINLAEESNNLNYNIPLEPIMEEKSNTHVLQEYTRKATHKMVSLIGAVATIVSLIISPNLWITVLLIFHIALYSLMKRLAHKKVKGTFGLVTDKKTGKEISKVVIRVFDVAYNKLVDTGVTDSKGRYAILVGPSTYYITAEKEGFITYQSPTIDFSSEKTNGVGGVISESFSLEHNDFHEKKGEIL